MPTPNKPSRPESDTSSKEARREAAAPSQELATARATLFGRLNPQQREAVFSPPESCLVLAGAGSGKTSVLTARIAWLVSEGLAHASSVLAVTFTNKAAQEMRERLFGLLDRPVAREVSMGTLHSLCAKFLRDNHEAAGLPRSFAILDTDGQEAICRQALKDLGLTKAAAKASRSTDVDAGEDTEADVEVVSPKDCVRYINGQKEGLRPPATVATTVTPGSAPAEQLNAVYSAYAERLRADGLVDFQDLLTRAVDMLKAHSDVRDSYRRQYRAILIDEFQDTNALQYELLELLKGPRAHVMAVGDDSQAIYSFRGAEPQFMRHFVKTMTRSDSHPNGRVIKLEENYRSLGHIVAAANALISHNPSQLKKTLFTSRPGRGERIAVVTHANGLGEATTVATEIHSLIRRSGVQPSEVAVIYRTNMQSRLIEQELNKLGVPLTVYGGQRFFQRAEIRNVLAYLELVCDITRDIAFIRVANFPPRDLGDRTVEQLRQEAQVRRMSMMETLAERSREWARDPKGYGTATAKKKQQAFEAFATLIMDLVESAQTISLSALITSIVENAGIRAHFEAEEQNGKGSAEEARERLSNISELVSAARQFELDNPELANAASQLPEYLAHVALMTSTSEASMEAKQTVSLMTAHSSKGLEFKHVYVIGVEEGVFPHSRALSQDEDARAQGRQDDAGLQEERRLMYVAITRAREHLTLTYALERMTNGSPKRCEPSRFLSELPNDLVTATEKTARGSWDRRPSYGNHEYGGDGFDDTRDAKSPHATAVSTPASIGDDRPRTPAAKLALIGTAGRDRPDQMSRALWAVMLADARRRVRPTDHLVSGGAAWADHLAVHLFLTGHVAGLTLHLPAPVSAKGYMGPSGKSAAAASNFYHHRFAASTGLSPFEDLLEAIAKGANITTQAEADGYGALFARNRLVAEAAGAVLAYTWAPGDAPDDGGTKFTLYLVRGLR